MAVVLVIEGDTRALEGLDSQLRSAGHQVRKAATVTEGLALPDEENEPLQFIVVGPRVPRADRWAVMAHADQRNCVLVALSSNSTARDLPVAFANHHASIDKWTRQQGGRSPTTVPGLEPQLIAVDPAMRRAIEAVDRAADRDSPLLITGETGSGKELLAGRAYRRSRRSTKPFVAVNCGGLPDTLVDTHLFGYCKGAFTGALTATPGMIDEADGGVLFLDEVGEMPPAMQVRLLRFLDSGECRRVGDTRSRFVDVRVTAATNRHLEKEVSEGRFRQDLFFRLSAITVHVPPLRMRRGDILPLADAHLRRVTQKYQRSVEAFADEAIAVLLEHTWPGNVRQLHHVVEHAVLNASGHVVTVDDLPDTVRGGSSFGLRAVSDDANDIDQLLAVLSHYQGDRRRAAAALGISRTTLWRRLRLPPRPSAD